MGSFRTLEEMAGPMADLFRTKGNVQKWAEFAVAFVRRLTFESDDHRRELASSLCTFCADAFPLQGVGQDTCEELAAVAFSAAQRQYTWGSLTSEEDRILRPIFEEVEKTSPEPGDPLYPPFCIVVEFARNGHRPPSWFQGLQ